MKEAKEPAKATGEKKPAKKAAPVKVEGMEIYAIDRSKSPAAFKFLGIATDENMKAFKKAMKVSK